MGLFSKTAAKPPTISVAGSAFARRTEQARLSSIQKAAAPRLPSARGNPDSAIVNVQPPFGTNPPQRPTSSGDGDLAERLVHNDPRELWYLALPDKLLPNQGQMILRAALGGDIWQQWQLLELIRDTWPMFRKCDHELREAVSNVRFVVQPYSPKQGQAPSASAQAKADAVRKAMATMRPSPFTDERELKGMLYHLAGAFANGIVMEELLWNDVARGVGGSWEQMVRAAVFVHPRHFTFANDGTLAIFDDFYNRLTFALAGKAGVSPNPDKFLCAQFYSASGSSLGAGFMRPLVWYWCSLVFNREWMLNTAKKWGSPFLKASYTGETDLDALDNFLKKAGPAGRIRVPAGVELEVTPAQNMGSDNPQRFLAAEADKQCQLLFLGQTLTSDAPKNGGTRAQGDVHMEVRSDRVQGIAKWMAAEPLAQFAQAVCRVNFGDDSEAPAIEPDFTEPLDAQGKAEFIASISASTVPLPAEDIYKTMGMSVPETGDKVLVGGKLGVLGDTETEIDAAPADPALFEGGPGEGDPMGKLDARMARRIAAKATPGELAQVEELVTAAERAPHRNGELRALRTKLWEIARR